MELDAISQPELDQIERMGRADLVVGILDLEGSEENGSNDVAMTREEALAELARPLRTMVICNNGAHNPAVVLPSRLKGEPRRTSLRKSTTYSLPNFQVRPETPQQKHF